MGSVYIPSGRKIRGFGGKKHDTSINNMGDVAKYNQKNKKKKGNASNWGSTYNA